jgi:hypothetical protein
MRARIDVSEIEAKTKIRAKYLRALENEEWGLLPGPTFVKSFLRSYAQALGLDGKALVEEYRLHHESPAEQFEPIVSSPGRRRRPPRGPSRGYLIAVGAVSAVILALIVLLAVGGSGSSGPASKTSSHRTSGSRSRSHHASTTRSAAAPAAPRYAYLSLHPTGVVYVCLVGDGGHVLIPGRELQPGEDTPTYKARRFEITLGNSAVELILDGRPRTVPSSSEAIGYVITRARGRQPLAAGKLPTCTS